MQAPGPHPRLWFDGPRVGPWDLHFKWYDGDSEEGGPQGSLREASLGPNNHPLQMGQLRLRERFNLQ